MTRLQTGDHPAHTRPAGSTASCDASFHVRWLDIGQRGRHRRVMEIKPGPECSTMAEVRAGVDALDRELVALLRRRFDYMEAAARIKPVREAVRDEERKQQVIAQAVEAATAVGLPVRDVAALWDMLVEASIGYELERFDKRDVTRR